MRFLIVVQIVLGIFLHLALVGCGDSKDSQSIESTQVEQDKELAQKSEMTQTKDFASVRELLGLQANSSAFYVLKGKVGDKEQVAYFSLLHRESDTGDEIFGGQDSQESPLYAFIELPNVWNEALGVDEYISFALNSQKMTLSKDERGLLHISGVWQSDFGDKAQQSEEKQWEQKSYFKDMTFEFIQDSSLPLSEVVFTQGKYSESLKRADEEIVSFESSYIKPIVLPLHTKLESKIIERLNAQFAQGAKDVPELQQKLKDLAKQDFRTYSQEEEKFNAEYQQSYSVSFIDSYILTFNTFSYVYAGGAHGVWGNEMESYSLHNGERLSNKIEDIFTLNEQNKNALLRTLTQKLDSPKYKERLFEGSLPLKALPQTFFITSQGINFVWHTYEIAPYVQGEISVSITYEDLKPFANPASPYAYLFGL
ncbi:DUF4163 domain-containing protein [Helicobacter sp. MIT 21-1697]|uniref:DUF3298 and DUF4163 domain-containing protein n=1 Tax=Helicobacter sp. MIT 21-1697 TaxID=2993733 RepID=UPI00224B8173|nr:DUF3298 and DUF4163 domain-containing protein [Helicobacter sp. MIT 21-1697]MCX2716766.1 DUF4163 domain-containing protein [Helicobacter sp. MIT 21-1697]